MRGVVTVECLLAGAELIFAERIERRFDRVEEFMQIAVILLDEQEPGDDLAGGVALLQIGHRRDPVARIVIGRELAQPQHRSVMLHDRLERARRVIGGDRLARHHEVELVDGVVMNATQGDMTSIKAAPLCWIAALISGTSCILSPEKLRATKEAPSCSAIATRSIGESVLTAPRRALEPLSAVAENWPLVSPYTPLFSTM